MECKRRLEHFSTLSNSSFALCFARRVLESKDSFPRVRLLEVCVSFIVGECKETMEIGMKIELFEILAKLEVYLVKERPAFRKLEALHLKFFRAALSCIE